MMGILARRFVALTAAALLAAIGGCVPKQEVGVPTRLDETRAAIERIEDADLRRDFLVLVDGAETGIRYGRREIAVGSASRIANTAIALNRTLTAEIAIGVLDGLWADTEAQAIAYIRPSLGFRKQDEHFCTIEPGTPVGSTVCDPSVVCSCYELEDTSGCALACDESDGAARYEFLTVW
jgi:hypothetical protein